MENPDEKNPTSANASSESDFLDDWDDDSGATREFDDLPYDEAASVEAASAEAASAEAAADADDWDDVDEADSAGSEGDSQSQRPTNAPVVLAPDKPSSRSIKRAIDVITRTAVVERVMPEEEVAASRSAGSTPWVLEQFFNGDIDLDVELGNRFISMPLMSTVKFREIGAKRRRGVATMSAADGSAQVILDVDAQSRVIQMSFTLGSMLTLRFSLNDLSDADRQRYIDLMRRTEGGLAFLWGPSRWENDYVICVARRYFTNFYAFSASNFEAAIRLTPDVTKELLDWLQQYWTAEPQNDEDDNPLLTW